MATQLDHFYTYGDVYEALDACQQLEILLGRVKRQRFIDDQVWTHSAQWLSELRNRLGTAVHAPGAGGGVILVALITSGRTRRTRSNGSDTMTTRNASSLPTPGHDLARHRALLLHP